MGYLRKRNDGIIEWVIGKENEIRTVIKNTTPFLRLKKKQARLMLEVLDRKFKLRTKKDFISLAKKIDLFRELNYSKKRKKRVY